MKKTVLLLALATLTLGAKAQLRSVGSVPADLKMSVSELYESDMQRARKYAGGRVKNKQKVQEASYRINKMMSGGHIVYGDPISRLAGRIADTLLVDYPELRSELRFYTVTSPEVNAFATGQGMVFINVGLMAQVENEAQLAFIISHEIIHYYRSHSFETLVGKRKTDKNNKAKIDQVSDNLGDMLHRHARSREMEGEADSLGIALFYLKSPYLRDVTEGVFDVLQYGALPFDDVEFDTTYFNTPHFSLTGCWLDTTHRITSRDDYDDSRSTHPNILSRRHSCAAALSGYYGGEAFVMTTPEEFMALRQMARVECIRQEVIHGQYPRAFYNSWLLLSDTAQMKLPANRVVKRDLETFIAHSLYGNAMFRNRDTSKMDLEAYKEVEGESQQIYYAMLHMTKEEATLAALNNVWKLHKQYPADESLLQMATDLMDDLHKFGKRANMDYSFERPAEQVAQADTEEAQPNAPKSKYDRIKKKRAAQAKNSPTTYALLHLASDEAFTSLLNQHLAGMPKDTTVADTNRIDGMLVFDPSYYIYDFRTEDMKVIKSTKREGVLARRMLDIGSDLAIFGTDFSDAAMHDMTDAEQYNDFLTLCEWSSEFWRTGGEFDMIRFTQPTMDNLLARHNANTVGYAAVLNIENVPGGINFGRDNKEYTGMLVVVVDAQRGKVLTRQTYNDRASDPNVRIDGLLYDSYLLAKYPNVTPKGYLGRRFAVAGGLGLNYGKKSLFYSPWLTTEYATGKRFSLTLSGRYQTAGKKLLGDILICEFGFRSYVQKLSKAPYCDYFGLGVMGAQISPLDKKASAEYGFGLRLSIGHNYVVAKRFLINFEFSYTFCRTPAEIIKKIDDSYRVDERTPSLKDDIASANGFGLRIGIGYLPF